jgi:hypothetical protein
VSDLISVDPDRCNQAAGQLDTLRDALNANVPTIINTLNMYWSSGVGSAENLGALSKAQGQAPVDAATMRTRAMLAAIAANGSQGQAYSIDGMVTIPGDPSVAAAADAQAEAQALAQAEANGNKQASRAAIQAIQQDIQSHLAEGQAGAAWLATFYNGAAPQVAGLANVLHGQDGTGLTPLSAQDQQILNAYATGLAAVDKSGALTQNAISQLTAAPTLWSATMLLKYGPSGSAYSTATAWATDSHGQLQNGQNGQPAVIEQGLLAQMTHAVYQASQNGSLTIPLNWQDAQWADQMKQMQSAMQSQDPFTSMLQLDAQNKVAAGQVLAGQDGAAIAKTLLQQPFMNYMQGYTQGYSGPGQFTVNGFGGDKGGIDTHTFMVDPTVIQNFLDAATQNPADIAGSPPRGNDPLSYQAAQAAINIINNAPSTNNIVIAEPVRQALLTTFGRYLPDIASSTNYNASQASGVPQASSNGGIWNLHLDGMDANGPLATFMKQIEYVGKDAGIMQGVVATAFGNQYGQEVAGAGQNPVSGQLAGDLAKLYGMTVTQQQNLGYSQQQATDAANAELNTIVSMAENAAGLIPGGGTVMTVAKDLKGVVTPAIPTFSTSNAAHQAASDLNAYAQGEGMLNVPMVQGLINAGVVVPPANASWYQNGQISPNGAFVTWWQMNKGYYVYDLPKYNNPPGASLPPNPNNSQTMEAWQNIYGVTNMDLVRQMQTAEGN